MFRSANRLYGAIIAAGTCLVSTQAWAEAQPWGTYLQPADTQVAEDIHTFGALTFWIVGIITLFVLGLLVYVVVRFNAKANPVPSKTSHNTMIEVVWTIAPIMILLIIAVPSFRLLYEELVIPDAKMTIKVTANKWYWNYEYPEQGDISFDSYMLKDEERTDPVKQPRLLAVDSPLVLPVGEVIRIQVTATDVIHSFAMQPFGVKIDAIPGRLNESWFKIENAGTFYGQCSELCGQNHAFMPIEIRAVTADQFAKWTEAAKTDLNAAKALLAQFDDENAKAPTTVAAN
ncbi:cytochrome c oxidase subunit II [Oryzibacter oryziterrae]|uniref:cytochrome c oxidase subunit II n=1 Tax=Oryzibacter oryziterrae TaxID=2766474 RepID=UPI001F01E3AB|nr:cytochrome c oxidase subunit II [Oryzibacter oryziterrae]